MSCQLKSVFATLPHTQRATAVVLNGDPKGKNFLYCNGKTVVIRDINNPGIADTYTQHSVQATVAQYAPSGFYIASGDVSGKIRIWDTVNKEHILKYEYQPFAGQIKDICWSPDSKRIAVCGQGRDTFGAVFLWDSGSSVGTISGHIKTVNSLSYKPTRPFRIVTASEDHSTCFFEGPPFKFKLRIDDHTNFVNSIRFSPDGNHYCSASSDGQAILYDGKTGERMGFLGGGNKAHAGGIYALCWNPDGSQVLTASADKSCKLWDVVTQQVVSEFKMGTRIEDQQIGCLWQGDNILSLSVSGNINYLDRNNPDKPLRILTGQNKNLKTLAVPPGSSTIYCGSMDGRISYWDAESGEVNLVGGVGHTNLVCSIVATPENLYSLGFDKNLRKIPTDTNQYSSEVVPVPDRDPTYVARSPDGLIMITTLTEIILVRDGKTIGSLPVSYQPLCAIFHPSRPEVAVGGKDSKVYIYTTENDTLNLKNEIKTRGEVNAVDYDATGKFLAVSGYARVVNVYDTTSYEEVKSFIKQSARVTAVKFSQDSKWIISCGIDSNICIYNMATEKTSEIRGAHSLSVISDIAWINGTTFASCGDDCCIRVWEFSG